MEEDTTILSNIRKKSCANQFTKKKNNFMIMPITDLIMYILHEVPVE